MADGVINEHLTLKRADGRQLGYAEYGDPTGHPVFAFHGVPGARYMFRPTAGPAIRHGLRIIAPDRPGYGLSEPQPGRQLADWLDDMLRGCADGAAELAAGETGKFLNAVALRMQPPKVDKKPAQAPKPKIAEAPVAAADEPSAIQKLLQKFGR